RRDPLDFENGMSIDGARAPGNHFSPARPPRLPSLSTPGPGLFGTLSLTGDVGRRLAGARRAVPGRPGSELATITCHVGELATRSKPQIQKNLRRPKGEFATSPGYRGPGFSAWGAGTEQPCHRPLEVSLAFSAQVHISATPGPLDVS